MGGDDSGREEDVWESSLPTAPKDPSHRLGNPDGDVSNVEVLSTFSSTCSPTLTNAKFTIIRSNSTRNKYGLFYNKTLILLIRKRDFELPTPSPLRS